MPQVLHIEASPTIGPTIGAAWRSRSVDASGDCSGWKLPTLLPSSGWKLQRRTSIPSSRIHNPSAAHSISPVSQPLPPTNRAESCPPWLLARNSAPSRSATRLGKTCCISWKVYVQPPPPPPCPAGLPQALCAAASAHTPPLSRFAERRMSSLIEVSSAQSEL